MGGRGGGWAAVAAEVPLSPAPPVVLPWAAEAAAGGSATQVLPANLAARQAALKDELRLAKQRLGAPKDRWSYDLHDSITLLPR